MNDVVTEILRRPGCRVIRLKGGESLTVPNALFRQSPLVPGNEVDPVAWRSAVSAQENRFALETAARMLESRDRSSLEIFRKLTSQGYSEEAADGAVAKLTSAGYLDDMRFARDCIARIGRKYGVIRVRQEMGRKGIPREMIDGILLEQDGDDMLDTAVKLAKNALRGKTKEPSALYRRAYGVLARRGYPPDIARKAIDLAFSDPEGTGPDDGSRFLP